MFGPDAGASPGPRVVVDESTADAMAEAEPRHRVAVVGDSLVEFAELGSPLRPDTTPTRRFSQAGAEEDWRLQVVGHHGWTTYDLLADIRRLGQTTEAVVVVAGSNDAARLATGQATPTEVQDWIGDALDALADVRCVVWANVTTTAPTIYWPTPQAPETVNAILGAEAARRPNLQILDWAATAAGPGLLLNDGLHHTVAGEARMVHDLVTATTDCLRTLPV